MKRKKKKGGGRDNGVLQKCKLIDICNTDNTDTTKCVTIGNMSNSYGSEQNKTQSSLATHRISEKFSVQ